MPVAQERLQARRISDGVASVRETSAAATKMKMAQQMLQQQQMAALGQTQPLIQSAVAAAMLPPHLPSTPQQLDVAPPKRLLMHLPERRQLLLRQRQRQQLLWRPLRHRQVRRTPPNRYRCKHRPRLRQHWKKALQPQLLCWPAGEARSAPEAPACQRMTTMKKKRPGLYAPLQLLQRTATTASTAEHPFAHCPHRLKEGLRSGAQRPQAASMPTRLPLQEALLCRQ